MTKPEWLKRAANIDELWPGKGWPRETVASSYAHFRNFTPDVVDAAIAEVFSEGREFAPAPSLLLARAREIDAASRPQLQDPDLTRPLTAVERERARAIAAALTGESAERAKSAWRDFAHHARDCVECERVANICRSPGLTTELADRAGRDVCDAGRPTWDAWRDAVRAMVLRYHVPGVG